MAVVELTKENFESTITSNATVIIDYWAPWCGPCRGFAPIYERVAEQHPDVVFAKVNTDEEQEIAAHFQIRSIPTLMVFRDQIVVFAQPGEHDDLVAKHHQRGNRADLEMRRDLLFLVGVHLGEHHVGMLLRDALVDRRETAARTTPRRPVIDDHRRVRRDGGLEVFLGQLDDGHRGSSVIAFTRLSMKTRPRVKGSGRAFVASKA